MKHATAQDLRGFPGGTRFGTMLADPPRRFADRTGKAAPEHRRLTLSAAMGLQRLCPRPVLRSQAGRAVCGIRLSGAFLSDELRDPAAPGRESDFRRPGNRKNGGSGRRGIGCAFRNPAGIGVSGTPGPGTSARRRVTMLQARRREDARMPGEPHEAIESCSRGPYLERFGRGIRGGWTVRGNRAEDSDSPDWKSCAHNSAIAAE
ncbi:S-adenosylmethionine-binding protein [Mangrovicoccus algicola]|uniref:S-adenosylmethionine-binding protein n=1 Tax=Mangrovicoccus algicola TaxID=2771008 RepID=A0A8J6Z0C3_9RHOB|nr:S-adenosylmethionine-binding protein [Mangrovicoccus algicola]MBE3639321.1 S-adenosylmethionine-binding protein [Mangrovicoccus algicola]